MSKPNALVDVSESTTVSNNSPQSPTGRALLEPITLDFDPMSFEFKEDSPLTSPSDSNREIGEMLSPSQNADVVEFFDPFCPVKEESPTDYYPNVMLGQTPLEEPLIDNLSEPQQFSPLDEPLDSFLEQQPFCAPDEPLIDNLSEPQQFANGFSDYDPQGDFNEPCQDNVVLNESFQNDYDLNDPSQNEYVGFNQNDQVVEELCQNDQSEIFEDEDALDTIDHEKPNEISDFYTNSEHTITSSKSETSGDVELLTELEQTHSEETCISPVSEQVFDDSKHDISSLHEQCQISEDDVSL